MDESGRCACQQPFRYTYHPVEIGAATRILKSRIPTKKFADKEPRLLDSSNSVTLIGRSWAGDATAFVIPELNLGLDAGYVVQGRRMSNYFVTHMHTDHAHFLTHLKSRSKPPNIYLPAESVKTATHYLDAAQQMTSHMTPEEYDAFPWQKAYTFVGVKPGDRKVIDKSGLVCDVVRCDHTVPCVGYCFSRVKQKLKPEFQGLPGPEIGKMRREGVAVSFEEEAPLFCFLGDTSVAGIFGNGAPEIEEARDKIFSSPTVIIECSYLSEDNRKQAETTKHVFWQELKPHVEANPQTTFVLIHFSHRWTNLDVFDFFRQEENKLPNVLPWVPEKGLFCGLVQDSKAVECQEVWGHN